MIHPDKKNTGSTEHYDLSEEGSRREDQGATRIAREVETDDVHEEEENSQSAGVPPESENRVWTSATED